MAALALTAAGLWLLLAPTSGREPAQEAGSATAASSDASDVDTAPATTAASTPTPLPSPPQESPEDSVSPDTVGPPPPAASEQDQNAAEAAAAAFMCAWFANDAPPAWWPGVKPLMTPEAATVYDTVDPAEIPTGQTLLDDAAGPTTTMGEPSQIVADVDVATTAGTYRLTLVRDSSAEPWLVDRLTPPETS